MRGPIPSRSVHRRRASPGARSTKPIPLLSRSSSALISTPARNRSCLRWSLISSKYSSSSSRCSVANSVRSPSERNFPAWSSAICRSCPQPGHVGFEIADRAREVGRGGLVRAAVTPQVPLVLQGADRDGVHLPDDLGLGEAVGQDPLAVADGLRVVQAGEQHLRGHLEEELVAGGHRLQQRVQLQVGDQVLVAGRQAGSPVEVPVPVQEVDLHRASRSPSRS